MRKKIALISDIHGNLPALQAVLADIAQRNIRTIYCLGDIVGKGPSSPECLSLCREACQLILAGNWELLLAQGSASWWGRQLGRETLQSFHYLPRQHSFMLGGKHILLYHGRPLTPLVEPYGSLESKEAIFSHFSEENPDWIGYGDTHRSYIQALSGKVLFNTGSVGNSLGIPMACYTILEETLYGPSVETIYLPYDREQAIALGFAADLPFADGYAQELRTGQYFNRRNGS